MSTIKVGDKVIYKGDNRPGTVQELWANKRALVDWHDGIGPGWSPIDSLRVVVK